MSTTKLCMPTGATGRASITANHGEYTVASDGTVTVDSRDVNDLISAGYTVFDDDLGTGQALKCGAHIVTSGENTANAAVIVTGLAAVAAFTVMIRRSGVNVSSLAAISEAAGSITVADNSTDYVLGTGDVIHWIAVGTA